MSAEYIKIVLDIVILLGLGGFMFYALRLSNALNAFRSQRNEFEKTMQQLSRHIDDAQQAVTALKQESKISGDELSTLVRDAQLMIDELQFINEAGNGLAGRLEGLAERNRKIVQGDSSAFLEGGFVDDENVSHIEKHRKPRQSNEEFMIQDREFEDEEQDFALGSDDVANDPALDELGSAAEKELYQALQSSKRKQ